MSLIKPSQLDWDFFSNYTSDQFIAEPKFDGMRLMIQKKNGQVTLLRESGLIKNIHFPEIIESAKSLPDDTILDGELCIIDSNNTANFSLTANFFKLLQRSTTNAMRIRLLSKMMPTQFVAFDILSYQGENLTDFKLTDRKKYLNKIKQIDFYDNIQLQKIQVIDVYKPKELFALNESRKHDLEGIIIKDVNETYNNSKWLKFKNFKEDDFKIVGFTSESRPISALILEDKDGKNVGNVNYTGYPQTEEMKKFVIGKTAVIKYQSLGEKLRFPILKEIRNV